MRELELYGTELDAVRMVVANKVDMVSHRGPPAGLGVVVGASAAAADVVGYRG